LRGQEATTGEVELKVVALSSYFVFVPVVLAQRSLGPGLIKEIKVIDWPSVEKKINLSVHGDLVSSSLLQMVTAIIKEKLR
jgi:hypothetical protein